MIDCNAFRVSVGVLLGASEGKILGPVLCLVLGATDRSSDGVGVRDWLGADNGGVLWLVLGELLGSLGIVVGLVGWMATYWEKSTTQDSDQ